MRTAILTRAAMIALVAVVAIGAGVALASGLQLPTVDDVVTWLSAYPAIIVLALITVTGETLVLAAVIVAVQGSWSLAEVVLWCFVGTVVSDAVWFALAGVVDEHLLRRRELSPRQERALAWLRRRTGERPYLALLFIKFMYGSRFLMIVYLATRRISMTRFMLYNAAGTAVWLAVLVSVGWLLAHGLVTVAQADRIDLVVLAIVAVLVALRGGSAWITARARRRSQPS